MQDRSGNVIDIYAPTRRSPSIVDRLDGYPDPNICWEWTGYIHPSGYGYVHAQIVHRVMYDAVKGPIIEGMVIDHLCLNLKCGNPDHLEEVTREENVRRQIDSGHHKWRNEFQ